MFNTDAVHPADVGRDTGEDGGLLVGVAARGRHKAGHTVDDPLAVDTAVQGATGVTLDSQETQTSEPNIQNLFAELGANSPFYNAHNSLPLFSYPPLISDSLKQVCAEYEVARLWQFKH